ncbi:hypothetical protein PIB30_091359, partial [Stylosanthes scabra]|nr:hypothetical protein [Stylosanthes scabra]
VRGRGNLTLSIGHDVLKVGMLQEICGKMPKVPRTLEATEDSRHRAICHNSPLAIRQVGNGASRPIPENTRPSKIIDCGNRLLHKVGGG